MTNDAAPTRATGRTLPNATRRRVWVSLLLAWVPMWMLCAGLLAAVHDLATGTAAIVALRLVIPAALLGLAVPELAARWPWPTSLSLTFLARHAASALAYGTGFSVLVFLLESAIRGALWVDPGWRGFGLVVFGVWLYVMIASFSYTVEEAHRAARAESVAVRTQLDALRGQLQPHFLFNALHAVVHLIPEDPASASHAAEELAGLLRTAMSETRDLIPLREEREFVTRYLALEQRRFEERLHITWVWSPEADDVLIPSFAVQTLVENAMRHGAAQRMGPTALYLSAEVTANALTVRVADQGRDIGRQLLRRSGSGLDRLAERLQLLYRGAAACTLMQVGEDRVEAMLTLPVLEDVP